MLNENIVVLGKKSHNKASETYLDVKLMYENEIWTGWIPIEYRRTGLFLKEDKDIAKYFNMIYEKLNPVHYDKWKKEQEEFWNLKKNANVTKSFYDCLENNLAKWVCVNCKLPKNPNWARRIQDLKEFGYTISTDTHRFCNHCNSYTSHLMLLPLDRQEDNGNGYETWSLELRKRIIKVLNAIDVYENVKSAHCLPDHKFSEIRWDENTKSENPDDMTDEEIQQKFQLLTNQRNQQKREICRRCYQTGKRGVIFGISFYYEGNENWDKSIPKTGKDAEKGCVGCPWYDIKKWREELIKTLEKNN